MSKWYVILEPAGGQPSLLQTVYSEKAAHELAGQVAASLRGVMPGARVAVAHPDSSDQLQVTKGGVALRDQPHLAAVGEDLTIKVEPARLGAVAPIPGT